MSANELCVVRTNEIENHIEMKEKSSKRNTVGEKNPVKIEEKNTKQKQQQYTPQRI